MNRKRIPSIELQKAIRNRLSMSFDPIYKEIGSGGAIANLIDAVYWGYFFEQPITIAISSKGNTISFKIEPGEFLIEQITGSKIPDELEENESLCDWILYYRDVNDQSNKKLYKFAAISPVIYCSKKFIWEFDTTTETIFQEYIDGIPIDLPTRKPRDMSKKPITVFTFELSDEVFEDARISADAVTRVFDVFEKGNAIPKGINIYSEIISPTDYVITLK